MWSQQLETILLVSDDPSISSSEDSLLEERGYRVLTAKDELEATAAYQDHWNEISLVILDVEMPERTFWELKRLDRNVNVLVVTDPRIDRGTVNELIREGAAFLLRNPYRAHRMIQAVGQALRCRPVYGRKTA